MYKRKVICSNPKHNAAIRHTHPGNGRVLYVLTESKALADSLPRRQECHDCGEARRIAEEKVKQDRLKRMFQDEEV